MSPRRIVVVGASGHGKVVAEAIVRAGADALVGFADDARSPGETFAGFPILGGTSDLARLLGELDAFVVAIGDGTTRERVTRALLASCPGLRAAVVVHPSAVVARDVELGGGTVVMAGAVLQPGVRVGEGCIVNTRASVDHDCTLGDYAAISPGATLGGDVRVGRQAFVGVGASIAHGRAIGDEAVVGAGAAVVDDVPPLSVALGVPARVARRRAPGERYL